MEIRKNRGRVPNWMIAEKLGIHENTFYRWMRTEMSGEQKKKVMAAIVEIKKEMEKEGVQR